MAYATRQDIEAVYTAELLLRIAWDKTSSAINDAAITAALDDASAEIDVYLSVRYVLPLNPIPHIVRKWAVDMAVYRVALTRDKLTAEMRQRYDDCNDVLKLVAVGKAGIGIPTISQPGQNVSTDINAQRGSFMIERRRG